MKNDIYSYLPNKFFYCEMNSPAELLSFAPNAEVLGMDRIFKTIDTIFDTKGNIYQKIKSLVVSSSKIILYGIVYILYKNHETVISPIKMLLLKLLYRRKIIEKNLGVFVKKQFLSFAGIASETPTSKNSLWINGIPVYLESEGTDVVLYYLSCFHLKFVEDLIFQSMEEKKLDEKPAICKDETGKQFIPWEMFPSDNYIHVDAICERYFKTYRDTKMITPPIIVMNGEGGLGKTQVTHYLGTTGKYKEIHLIDLRSPTMINKGFTTIVADLINKGSLVSTIICFDELDKYIELYTQHLYTTSRSQPIKKEGGCYPDEIVDEDFSIFQKQVKRSIISTISRLDSVKNFRAGVVFMFFCNNFQTLFEGLNQTHIHSVKSRFTFIQFKKCDRDELIRYITHYNSLLTDPQQKYSDIKLRCSLRKLKFDIDITYREIQICMNRAEYDIAKMIEYINEGEIYNPLLSVEDGESATAKPSSKEKEIENEVIQYEKKEMEVKQFTAKRKEKMDVIQDIFQITKNSETSNDNIVQKMLECAGEYNLVELVETIFNVEGNYTCIALKLVEDYDKAIEYLLKNGMNPNLSTEEGSIISMCLRCRTPRKHLESFFLLMEYGADISSYDYSDLEDVYVDLPNATKICRYLVEEKNFNINTIIGIATPFYIRCIINTQETFYETNYENRIPTGYKHNEKTQKSCVDFLKAMVQMGADLNKILPNKKTCCEYIVFLCIKYKHLNMIYPSIVQFFLEEGFLQDAKIAYEGHCGFKISLLALASSSYSNANKQFIQKLLDMGASEIPLLDETISRKDYATKFKTPQWIMDMLPNHLFLDE